MPFKSSKQRRYLWAKEPEIARKWEKEMKYKKKNKMKYKDGGMVDSYAEKFGLSPTGEDNQKMEARRDALKNYKKKKRY